jgi:hypothetical protein
MIMSVGAIGAIGGIGAVGIGAMGGMSAAAGAHASNPGGMVTMTGSANGVAKSAAAEQMASPSPSTKVDISMAGHSALSRNGVQPGTSMAELVQALILALLLDSLNQQGQTGNRR